MDSVHLHLMLNHIPMAALGFGLLFLLLAQFLRSSPLRSAAILLFLISAVVAVPVVLTGERTEERVEHIAGMQEHTMESHEEAAKMTLPALTLLGVSSIAYIWMYRRKGTVFPVIVGLIWFSALSSTVLMTRAAYLGGQIRHTEISSNQASPMNNTQEAED